MGEDKVFVNQVLAAEPKDLEAIQKNPTLMADLQNLSGPELNSKYLNSDGSVNEKLVYGSKVSEEASEVLNKTISNEKVSKLFKAIEENKPDEIRSILASVNVSEEDEQKLITEAQQTGGDYRREGNINKKRKLYFATLSSLVPGSALFNTLTSPNNAIANWVEAGMINSEGIDAMSKIRTDSRAALTSAIKPFETAFEDFNNKFREYQNPDSDSYGDWNAYRDTLGTSIRRMRSEAAAFGDNPPAQVRRQLVQAEADLARAIIKAEGEPGFLAELVTLGFADGPAEESFGNMPNVKLEPANPTSADKVTAIILSNGKPITVGYLSDKYGAPIAAALINLAAANQGYRFPEDKK